MNLQDFYQTTIRGSIDEVIGIARVIILARGDKAIIIAIGKDNSTYFLPEDIREMDGFISGIRLGFGPVGY